MASPHAGLGLCGLEQLCPSVQLMRHVGFAHKMGYSTPWYTPQNIGESVILFPMNGNILIQHHNWLKWCLVLRGLCQLRNCFLKLEVSNPQGYPQIIHFILVYSIINHPAIGVPPFMETSLVLWPESSGSDRWGEAYQARGFLRVSLKASNPKVRSISCRTISWTIGWRTISWLVVELLVDHFPMNQSISSPFLAPKKIPLVVWHLTRSRHWTWKWSSCDVPSRIFLEVSWVRKGYPYGFHP